MTNERTIRSIHRLLPRRWFPARLVVPSIPAAEQPLRAELFSVEQMENYGKSLAETHGATSSRAHGDKLLSRLVENESELNEVRTLLTDASAANTRIGPAGDTGSLGQHHGKPQFRHRRFGSGHGVYLE